MALLVLLLGVWSTWAGGALANHISVEPPQYPAWPPVVPDMCTATVTTGGPNAIWFRSNLTSTSGAQFEYHEDGTTLYFLAAGGGVQTDVYAADVTWPNGTDGTRDWVAGLCANGLPATPSFQSSGWDIRFTFEAVGLPLPCSQQQPRYIALAVRTVLVSRGNGGQ